MHAVTALKRAMAARGPSSRCILSNVMLSSSFAVADRSLNRCLAKPWDRNQASTASSDDVGHSVVRVVVAALSCAGFATDVPCPASRATRLRFGPPSWPPRSGAIVRWGRGSCIDHLEARGRGQLGRGKLVGPQLAGLKCGLHVPHANLRHRFEIETTWHHRPPPCSPPHARRIQVHQTSRYDLKTPLCQLRPHWWGGSGGPGQVAKSAPAVAQTSGSVGCL